MEFQLHMPASASDSDLNSVGNHGVVVVLGANGSGKSRLGAWIELESEHKNAAHRVSAQKSLDMPASSSPTSIEEAEAELLYGYREGGFSHKLGHRWRNKPSVSLLNDFGRLMIYLFSDEFEKSTQYRKRARASDNRLEPPETKLDTIERIWESILINRRLIIGGGKVEVKSVDRPGEPYNAQEMSDGERVIFYLIGECLAAPADAVVVIDEPEMHLHKSIQSELWDSIEAERPDCMFVYLTHDLDFATSRVGAPKICLREYDGEQWDWYLVPEESPIPEDILLQIVGSRKPVLFIEGEKSSLDYLLLSYLYPDFAVVPCGGCSRVIHATRSFASFGDLHHLDCRGLVDRDHRTDDEVASLEAMGISVLEVSEIENLLLHKQVLEYVGSKLGFADELGKIVEDIERVVFKNLSDGKTRVAVSAAARAIQTSLTSFDGRVGDEEGLVGSWEDFVGSVDPDQAYARELDRIQDILDTQDYEGALRIYDNKGLIYQVSPLFGMKADGLVNYIRRLISNERDEGILSLLERYVPVIDVDDGVAQDAQ